MTQRNKKDILSLLNSINISRIICSHIMGEKHTKGHRMIAGFIIMIGGVGMSEVMGGIHFLHLSYLGHIVGYGIHGVGLVPFIEHLVEKSK